MRNDSLDELDDLPSLTIDDRASMARERELPAAEAPRRPASAPVPPPAAPVRRGSSRLPWLLVGGLSLALVGLGWWGQQQIARMEQQLVATQESFARISEDAAGNLKDISSKVVATESSVASESEALKLRVKQLESKLAQLGKQQQATAEQQGTQERQLEQLRGELKSQRAAAEQLAGVLKEQQGGVAALESRLQGLAGEQAELKAAQGEVGKLDERVQSLAGEVAALKKQGNPTQAIKRLEDDLLVLRSQLDSRPAAGNSAELEALRAQLSRNITALQGQVQNLQQQLDAR